MTTCSIQIRNVEVITIPNPNGSHHGGWIGFGPNDDFLYIATGDGGNVGPVETKGLPSQDLTSWQGKLLRIDVDGTVSRRPDAQLCYPAQQSVCRRERSTGDICVGASSPVPGGLRRANGDLYIGDVGFALFSRRNEFFTGRQRGRT